MNGVPGRTHRIERAEQIGLSEEQRNDIEAIRAKMQADAILADEQFVAAKQTLDFAFQQGAPGTMPWIAGYESGEARTIRRLVHLNAHLQTTLLLAETPIDSRPFNAYTPTIHAPLSQIDIPPICGTRPLGATGDVRRDTSA